MRKFKLLAALLLALLLALLVLQNRAPIETHLLVTTVTMPQAMLLFLTGAAGFILGVLVSLLTSGRSSRPAR